MFQKRSWRLLYSMESLAERVAQRCHTAVLQRVLPEAATMNRAEAGGYVRARSTEVVVFHTGQLLTELDLPRECCFELASLAKRRVVALVLESLKKPSESNKGRRRAA